MQITLDLMGWELRTDFEVSLEKLEDIAVFLGLGNAPVLSQGL